MPNILEPTSEEHAYYEGWTAYFNERYDNELVINPYDETSENSARLSWDNGYRAAKTVATSMAE